MAFRKDCDCTPEATWARDDRRQPSDVDRIQEQLEAQNALLQQMVWKLDTHLKEYTDLEPVLKDIVTLWRGSKLIVPILAVVVAVAAGFTTAVLWAKDHLR